MALFLDFDGTITPLRPRPGHVTLKESTRQVLSRMVRLPAFTLCFISGRRRADLMKLVRVRGALYVGLHGWERGNGTQDNARVRGPLAAARRALIGQLAGLPGVRIRDKGPCIDVHYHGASNATFRKARAIVFSVFRTLTGHAQLLRGRDVWEFLPKDFEGKGAAVREILAEIPFPALPIYIGDDTTDEYAFRALPNGITIRVGKPRRTRARYELRNPEEVIKFLRKVGATIGKAS